MSFVACVALFAATQADASLQRAESAHYAIEVHGIPADRPALSPPPRPDERGFVRRADAEEALAVLEAAWSQYEAFFDGEPRREKDEKLRISLHESFETMSAAIRAGGGSPPTTAGGYYCPVSRTAFLFRQPTRWYTRALLIHEAAHQFHWLVGDTRKGRKGPPPVWWGEGVVEHLAHHTWDGEHLRLGVIPPISLEDYPSRALAGAATAEFRWETLPTQPENRPLQMHLTRWLATSQGGKSTAGFRALRERLDRGESVDEKALLKATGLKSDALDTTLDTWLASVQQPYVWLFNEWDSLAADRVRGTAQVVASCRTRAPVSQHAAKLRPLHGGRWRAGLLVHYASNDDHTIAVIDSGRELRVDRWNGGWKVLGVHALQSSADSQGWWSISAERDPASGRVLLQIGEQRFGPYELPEGPMGLAIDGADVEFQLR